MNQSIIPCGISALNCENCLQIFQVSQLITNILRKMMETWMEIRKNKHTNYIYGGNFFMLNERLHDFGDEFESIITCMHDA